MPSTLSRPQPSNEEERARHVGKIVHDTEKQLAALKDALNECLRTEQKMRGRRLKLALAVKGMSEGQPDEMKKMMTNVAESLVDLEEYRQYMHDRIDTKVTEEMKVFKAPCQNIRDDLRNRENGLDKQKKKQQDLDRVSTKESGNRSKISSLQQEIEAANLTVSQINKSLGERGQELELKRLDAYRTTIFEFVYSEMEFHARSLEIMTKISNEMFRDANLERDTGKVKMAYHQES